MEEQMQLDIEQKKVIEASTTQWMLVNAGPGTGKTQVSALRLIHLLRQGLHPAQILVLSFSRSAVATLSRRLDSMNMLDGGVAEDLRHLAIRTFDAWAFRVLRQSGAAPKSLLQNTYDENIANVTSLLNDENAIQVHERLRSIRHVIVDEFQDLPGVRSEMVLALLRRLNDGSGDPVGFTVLGDPAQAIYRFAARATGNLPAEDPWLELKHFFSEGLKEVELTRNHRSVEPLAKQVEELRGLLRSSQLDGNQKLEAVRHHLASLSASESGKKIGPDWLVQQSPGSVAVLTRTNGEAIQLAQMLIGNKQNTPPVPVRLQLAGQAHAVPAWVGALLGPLKVQKLTGTIFNAVYSSTSSRLGTDGVTQLHLPSRDTAWQRLLRASGAADTDTSIDMEALRERLAWPDAFPEDRQDAQGTAVYVTTIHQAKGMEFDHVALLDTHSSDEKEDVDDPVEEANVGFVGITRAGQTLSRLEADCIWRPPYEREMRDTRKRYVSWGGMVNMQSGLPGDIDPTSFVSVHVLGSEEAANRVQSELLQRGETLRGRKVELRKTEVEKLIDARYDIYLLEDDGNPLLIGRTAMQLTADLLHLLWSRKYTLPNRLFNLRISDVVTVTVPPRESESITEPWRSSRIWLGVTLAGTADFKPFKRKGA
ncbi:ATP-dependent helicase [Pseudomonas aeruginosa]|uniref:UvrD-helicase domain-containing protein n=1 Tax=Pseudomonas aeruginosa TaxID=287 RepID=UPI0004F2A934|nr:ATP-dependent helicase [Pseudomonas aeruginosa]EKX5129220.1 ATP-dependent helicase [Pseudomonas aeruginosa]EMC2594287.1 ATP-dependent helicase [Pseudomonas aeruginosa]MBI8438525.1 ATP-dependent helicase [Pseudomonas aeruginosa]MBI8906828.1 ATP-dependent helicase [Pseudomonas aeruginosa]MCO7686113.1 ATP-dependent helicase [Pseudomonas aeruginosa]